MATSLLYLLRTAVLLLYMQCTGVRPHSRSQSQASGWSDQRQCSQHRKCVHKTRIPESSSRLKHTTFGCLEHPLPAQVHHKTWSGWSWECLVKWGPFLRLGLPSLVLVSEWWASETAVFMAGYLAFPQLSLAAMAIYHNSASLAFMLPAGMAVACSTR